MIAIARYVMDTAGVPFEIVSQETGLDPYILRKLVRDGVLPGEAPYYKKKPEGHCDLDAARRIARQLDAARKSVEGVGILATAVQAKYGFSNSSVYKWHIDGWVKVVETLPSGDRLFNEGDIAYARALANLSGHAPGKKVFPKKLI